jgi:hypothetical protein
VHGCKIPRVWCSAKMRLRAYSRVFQNGSYVVSRGSLDSNGVHLPSTRAWPFLVMAVARFSTQRTLCVYQTSVCSRAAQVPESRTVLMRSDHGSCSRFCPWAHTRLASAQCSSTWFGLHRRPDLSGQGWSVPASPKLSYLAQMICKNGKSFMQVCTLCSHQLTKLLGWWRN